MGCGESKHSVATENTITRKKSSKKIKTINETNGKENLKQEETDNNDNGGGVAEVKDITEDNELKEEEKEMKKEDQDQETGRLISKESPNRFFSSRKDEDINEGSFVSEGRSEKSEFFSPRLESGKEILFNECVKLEDVVEEKLVQETEYGETSIVKEEDMAKEEKASTSPPEEKKQIVEEETLAVSPSKDQKAT